MDESENTNGENMQETFQKIIDATDILIGSIAEMDWNRIEALGNEISESAQKLKILAGVN